MTGMSDGSSQGILYACAPFDEVRQAVRAVDDTLHLSCSLTAGECVGAVSGLASQTLTELHARKHSTLKRSPKFGNSLQENKSAVSAEDPSMNVNHLYP